MQVNERLQAKVYLAGPHVTLADLVLFATLHRALVRQYVTSRHDLSVRHRRSLEQAAHLAAGQHTKRSDF